MDLPVRRSWRLAHFDYASSGWYFVTVCTWKRQRLLARAVDREMRLTRAGRIVDAKWHLIPELNPGVTLDRFVVMPDHIHGLVHLGGQSCDRSRDPRLTTIIGAFKSAASREIRRSKPRIDRVWQRSFHEWIVRSDFMLANIQRYIERNPERWTGERGLP